MRHLRTLIMVAVAGLGFYLFDIPGLIGGGLLALFGMQMAPRDSFVWADTGSGSSDGWDSGDGSGDGGGGGDGGGD